MAPRMESLPKEWGPRNTRKDAKGDERCRLGGPCHIARPDIGQGTRSCAIRRGISKKRATAIFDLSPRVGPPSLCVLLCKFSLLSSVRARFRSGGLHKEVIMPGASITSSTIPARRASQRSVRSNGRTANVVGAWRNHGRPLNRGAVPPVFRPQSIAGKS
jgi:hypothetical protein